MLEFCRIRYLHGGKFWMQIRFKFDYFDVANRTNEIGFCINKVPQKRLRVSLVYPSAKLNPTVHMCKLDFRNYLHSSILYGYRLKYIFW